jgi:oligopeptide transport system substrate-binding protein
LALLVVLSAALIAVGCGDSGSDSDDSSKLAAEQVLTWNTGSEITALDPPLGADLDSWNVVQQVFDGLYRFEGEGEGELVPRIASDLPEVSDDGLTYTVPLRDDAVWSNGDPLTANDVVYGFRRAMDPATGAYFAAFFQSVVGACELTNSAEGGDPSSCTGEKTDGTPESLGVEATDDHTVVFHLKEPVPWFDQLLATNIPYPIHQATVEKFGEKWVEPANIVSSGPYKLTAWKHDQSMTLTKFEDHWDADNITVETVNLEMVEEPQTALRQWENEELDSGDPGAMIPSEEIDAYKGKDEFYSALTAASNYVYMNTTNPELKDPKVRQGIALAINRQAIVDNITKKGDKALGTIIPSGLPGYDSIQEATQDFLPTDSGPNVDLAKELLAEGGWNSDEELSLYYTTESGVAQAVAEQVQSDLGDVDVKVKLVPLPTAGELYAPGVGTSPIEAKVDMTLLGWIADYFDPQDWYQLFTCDNVEAGLNPTNFCDEEFDKVYAEALQTVDLDARTELYKELEGMLTGPDGAMPAAPTFQDALATVVHPWVEGYELTSGGSFYFDKMKITEH